MVKYAFPHEVTADDITYVSQGMLLRDYIATHIIQGLVSDQHNYVNLSDEWFTKRAVRLTDLLIKELGYE